MKKLGRDFFHFTLNERRGLFVLSSLIFIAVLANVYISKYYTPKLPGHEGFARAHALYDSLVDFEHQRDSAFLASTDKLDVNEITSRHLQLLGIDKSLSYGFEKYRNAIGGYKYEAQLWRLREMDSASFDVISARVFFPERESPKPRKKYDEKENDEWRTRPVFAFSLSEISDEEIRQLPVPERFAKGWINYRKKGGAVNKPEDLYNLFNADSSFIDPLIPHIKSIPERETKVASIDLNTADSLTLMKVSGIGPVYASRILKMRERLGGFVDVFQLTEVYGIDSSKVLGWQNQLSLSGDGVEKLDVNSATVKQLGSHPYISWELAREVESFRENIRPFARVDELRKLQNISPEKFRKIAPYIYVGDKNLQNTQK